MLYNCVECGREIAEDAWRCPHCGTKDAGSRAWRADYNAKEGAREAERDRLDPGWRERERKAREEAEKKEKARSDTTSIGGVAGGIMGGLLGGLMLAVSCAPHGSNTAYNQNVSLGAFWLGLIIFGIIGALVGAAFGAHD